MQDIDRDVFATGSTWFESHNPASPSVRVGRWPVSTDADVDAAVSAAVEAAPTWAAASPGTRSGLLRRAAASLRESAEEIAAAIVSEVGKPVAEAAGEVANAAGVLDFFADRALLSAGTSLRGAQADDLLYTVQAPVGLVAVITPWNFPVNSPAIKIAAALAFGNTVVFKPAEQSTASSLRFVAALRDAGVPHGVVSVLLGPGNVVGERLIRDSRLDGISFTGSTEVGRRIRQAAAEGQARVQCEMGGKNALVVLDDADLELAAQLAVDGAFRFAGQRCTATSRVIAVRSVAERLQQLVAEAVRRLSMGDPADPAVFLGPLIDENQHRSVSADVDAAVAAGASVACGGSAGGSASDPDEGYFYPPTVLVNVKPEDVIARKEVFGPVLCFIEVDDLPAAIEAVNATEYGLTSAVVTRDLDAADAFVSGVRTGAVAVNSTTAGWDYRVSFGGWKNSGIGYPEQGTEAEHFFTRLKTIRIAHRKG